MNQCKALYQLTKAKEDSDSLQNCETKIEEINNKIKENKSRGREWFWLRKQDEYTNKPGLAAFYSIEHHRYTTVDIRKLPKSPPLRLPEKDKPNQPYKEWPIVEVNDKTVLDYVISATLGLKGGGAVVIHFHYNSTDDTLKTLEDVLKNATLSVG